MNRRLLTISLLVLIILGNASMLWADSQKATLSDKKDLRYYATGKVVKLSPISSQITIEHGVIKGFEADGQTEFFVTDVKLLDKISVNDLINFEIVDHKGDARIDKIIKIGYQEPQKETLAIGQAIQGALEGTGQVAKTVTSVIPPANEVVNSTVDATTNTTGQVLNEADGAEVKQTF